jgi:VIT1/CCC1 family predicted Fe2+/Mn2+ transporter
MDVEEMTLSVVEGVEETVVEVYEVILEAERAGVDVSGLLHRLDVAGEYLTLARMCLRTGNLEGAARNASLSEEALDGLVEDAGVLRERAVKESDERFWMAIGGSVVGVVTVVCGGWLGWSWFKRWYYRRALEMKPEVVEYES